jgi:predicted DNA-binding transcriptional regulator YafY
VEHAERLNAAVALLEAGVPVGQAARVLAGRFGVSVRQARRYVDQAAVSGRVPVPEASVVFTVKLPAGLAERVRAHARDRGWTISAVVTHALTEFLRKGHPQRPGG